MKRTGLIQTALWISLLPIPLIQAADTKQVQPAPVPAQIVAAKRVFIANAGGDDPGIHEPLFSGGLDRAYSQFYDAIKSSGRYELVGSPAEADLLLEIRFTVIPDRRPAGLWGSNNTGDAYDALFRVEIRDPKLNALLWAFNEQMEWAMLLSNRNRNFDQASARIANDVLSLAARAAAANAQPTR